MVKGWPMGAKGQPGGWGSSGELQPRDDKPRPPQQPPPCGTPQKGSWKKQLPHPSPGRAGPKGTSTEASWFLTQSAADANEVLQEEQVGGFVEDGLEDGEEQSGESMTTEMFMAAVQPRPGETEREAKVRAMAERIRAEARRGREEEAGESGPQPLAKRRKAPTAAEKQKEEQDAEKFQALLPKLEEKVSAAEDEAEKVTILAAPLAMEAVEELKDLQMTAIRDTERAVKTAFGTVGKARRELEMRGKEIESMAPLARDTAKEEMAKLASRLDAAQAKLDEHKNVRKDHELSLQAEKLFGELASRLAGVEIDCEKAAMMSEPLAKALDTNPHDINTSEIRETKEALRVAQATLAPTMRLISGKVSGLKGAIRNKMLDLQSRAEASQALLDKAQRTVEESQSRAASIPILKQAQERVATIEEVLQKMRETEAPFLMGIETMPPQEAGEVLARMDKAAALAQSALADATKYIALKAVEVGRLAEGAAEAARKELDRVKQQLDDGVARVKAFQVESGKRRRLNLVEVVKVKIEEAEAAVAKMKEAATELQATEPGEVTPALEKAHAVELEAQNAVTAARRELQEKQQDLRPMAGADAEAIKSSGELLKTTKLRVSSMEAELAKFRRLAKEFEERIKVSKSLGEVLQSLREAEEEVDRISTASEDWPADAKPPEEAERSIALVQSRLSSTIVQVEAKLQTAQGLELRELRGIFSRLQKSQGKLDRVKGISKERSKNLSLQIVKDAADAVQRAEAKVVALNASHPPLASMAATKLETLHEQACAATEAIAGARAALAQGQGLETAAKVELARLQLRFKAMERKGKLAAEAVSAQFERTAAEATQQVLSALRSSARREDGSYDAESFFAELSSGSGEISETQFCEFFTKHKTDLAVPIDKVKLAFKRVAPHGLLRRTFISALAESLKVVRDITITDEFEIQSAKKVRKLQVGEVVEALGEAKHDVGLGLERVNCRALLDGTRGWVTIRSTTGTCYLKPSEKPFLWCAENTPMRSKAEAESDLVREIKAGEVLELVQGPREERLGCDTRVRGVSCGEETTGWLQVQNKNGDVLAKLSTNIYKCSEPIAMTDTADFGSCNMVRRIDAGEALELLRSEKEVQPSEGGVRRKFRACRDGEEGWVTVRGSQGTLYVKQASKHYVCTQASPIHAGLGAESAVVRVLMQGEAFAAFEEPKEVAGGEQLTMYSVRAVTDGKEGWVTCSALAEVRAWCTRCKVLKTVQLTKGFPANEAAEVIEVVRLLEPNEHIDITEQPTEDSSSGQLRARCLALKDKAIGWVTVRDGNSAASLLLRPLAADEVPAAKEAIAPEGGELGGAAPTTPPAAAAATMAGGGKPAKFSFRGPAGTPYLQGGKALGKGGSKGPPLIWHKGRGKGKE